MDTPSTQKQERYHRSIQLPELGEAGQSTLAHSQVLIIGAGGLGSPASLYLAAAGVGTLGLADADVVDLSNLQRQILHETADLGTPKVYSGQRRLRNLNPHVKIQAYHHWVTPENIQDMIAPYDFVVEATDSIHTKFLVNDACVKAGKPYSHAGIQEFQGQTMTVLPGSSACFRCLFPEDPPAGKGPELGVLGSVAGLLGTIQATETIKHLTGAGECLYGTLLGIDTLIMHFRKTVVPRATNCPACNGL
ncbi:HesA/MoeB/ThiF family protein [Desulfurispira natronophila]|uniref:Molybdopterin/thiamine biosynthesis adenylyltransferase n=1 Tax=Desulfurispira natronophila TaxID=682562 RepID=A0A7W7Y562_9BACT|nr:HesA/MoeB/ThiF family protein [Desulfurispira natronophila]MBB5022219.1 molybdopterin/thiamine biosynthesis adenylyltransferase [Desulfurispira natronophila]